MMVGVNQSLQYTNVISRYYQMDYDEFSDAFSDFLTTVLSAGYHIKDSLFYAILTDITVKTDMVIQVFVPVEEEQIYALQEEYSYQTYFQVLDMVGSRVEGDSEKGFEAGLSKIVSFIVENDLEDRTPPFFVVRVDEEKTYTDILIGVR